MIKIRNLITSITLILAILTLPAPARASELSDARADRKALCLKVPECAAALKEKTEERNRKALEKVRKEIEALKVRAQS
jgi:hypothetical protein